MTHIVFFGFIYTVKVLSGEGSSTVFLCKWGMAPSAACESGADEQTADYVITSCPAYRHPCGNRGLTTVDDNLVSWLTNTCPTVWGSRSLFMDYKIYSIRRRYICCTKIFKSSIKWNPFNKCVTIIITMVLWFRLSPKFWFAISYLEFYCDVTHSSWLRQLLLLSRIIFFNCCVFWVDLFKANVKCKPNF